MGPLSLSHLETQPLSLLVSPPSSPKQSKSAPPKPAAAATTPAKTPDRETTGPLLSKLRAALSSARSLVASLPPLPLPASSPDLFRAALSSAPASRARELASSARRRLAHPSPGILASDKERHVAICVLGVALLAWLAAAAAGAAAGDGGACVVSSPASSSLAAAASCVRGGRLPLLWFDGMLRKVGPLLPLPLLLSRAAVARSPLAGGGSPGGGGRPAAHFVHVASVYAAAAAARLAVYLPHRAGLLERFVAFPSAVVARAVGGRAAVAPQGLQARALALAARAAAAAPFTSLLPFSSPWGSKAAAATTHHLMSDHLFLGACVGAVLCAEGVLLLSDARRHSSKSSDRTRVRLLLAGAALCALLYAALCLDMAFTAAYFHARHESAAAVAAGLVAFQAPLALWLLGGVKEARRAVAGAVGSRRASRKSESAVRSRPSSRR